jgi:predicted nucleic acid-binding protein
MPGRAHQSIARVLPCLGRQPIHTGAIDRIEAWLESPSLVPVGEAAGYWQSLKPPLQGGLIEGPRVHDARIAALCLPHGVGELWSADLDFSRFPALKVRNPLVD